LYNPHTYYLDLCHSVTWVGPPILDQIHLDFYDKILHTFLFLTHSDLSLPPWQNNSLGQYTVDRDRLCHNPRDSWWDWHSVYPWDVQSQHNTHSSFHNNQRYRLNSWSYRIFHIVLPPRVGRAKIRDWDLLVRQCISWCIFSHCRFLLLLDTLPTPNSGDIVQRQDPYSIPLQQH